jgi:hypothetical protein
MINVPSVRPTVLGFLVRIKLAQLHVDLDGAVSVPSESIAALEYHLITLEMM